MTDGKTGLDTDIARGQRRLEGRVAVITGAGSGIGQGCALMFAAQGARVVAIDRDAALLAETAARATGTLATRQCDMLDEAATNALVDEIGREHGRIDILVPAAAASLFHWIEDMRHTDWRRTLEGELDIVFLVTRAAWPWLKRSGSASIINFASANAHMALEGSAALAHCAGKGGVLAMTRQLAMEGASHGIRANSISPGLILTRQTRKHMAEVPEIREAALRRTMAGHLGEPQDIAWCATWLASTEAGFVTGADIAIDGGATAW